jgi:hypothetical protein
MRFIQLVTAHLFRRAARRTLQGRRVDRLDPSRGRFRRADVDRILAETWVRVGALLPLAKLDRVGSVGSRQNAFLAVVSLAAYRSLVAEGVARDYATELCADVGWSIYAWWVKPPRLFARLRFRDPQKQMNFVLRTWLAYPFRPPGYERRVWAEPGRLCTDWSRCPPLEVVRALGDADDVAFFRGMWCAYDYAVAREITPHGHFERQHLLSAGDAVCDMRWYGGQAAGERNATTDEPR